MITEQEYLKSVKIVNEYLLQQVKVNEFKKNEKLIHIVDSDISVRLYNCLKLNGIQYLNEISKMEPNDLMRFRNFGRQTLNHLEETMRHHGLYMSWTD